MSEQLHPGVAEYCQGIRELFPPPLLSLSEIERLKNKQARHQLRATLFEWMDHLTITEENSKRQKHRIRAAFVCDYSKQSSRLFSDKYLMEEVAKACEIARNGRGPVDIERIRQRIIHDEVVKLLNADIKEGFAHKEIDGVRTLNCSLKILADMEKFKAKNLGQQIVQQESLHTEIDIVVDELLSPVN